MADSEVKIRITTDASGAITGFKTVRDEVDKTEKQSAGLVSKLKGHWLGLTAAVAGVAVSLSKAWDLAAGSAQYLESMQNLSGLAAAYGTTATEITDKIQSIGDGMISMATSADVAYSGLAKNLKPDMLYGLAKAATVLNDSMGMTADEAFQSMASALELNKQKSLKLAVGTIDLKDRYGDLASKMSEAEKQSAFYNLIMEKTNEISTRLGGNTKSTADRMETFQVKVANLKTELGIMTLTIVDNLLPAMGFLNTELSKDAGATWGKKFTLALIPIEAEIYRLAMLLDKVGGTATSAQMLLYGPGRALGVESSTKRFEAAADANMMFQKRYEESDAALVALAQKEAQLQAELAGNVSSPAAPVTPPPATSRPTGAGTADKSIASLIKSWKEMAMTIAAKMESQGLDDLGKKLRDNQLEADQLKEKYKNLPQALRASAYETIDKQKTGLDIKAHEDAAIEQMKKEIELGVEATKSGIDRIKERGEAARDLYKDMKGYEQEYYNESLKLIDDQVGRFRAAALDEIAIEKWKEEQKRLAALQIKRSVAGAGTFDEGWSEGIKDWGKDVNNMFVQGEKLAKTTAQSMSSSFSDFFFDAVKGECKSFQDYFQSFADSILKAFTDMLADMVAKWIMETAKMTLMGSDGKGGLLGAAVNLGMGFVSSFAGANSGQGLGVVSGSTPAQVEASGGIVAHSGGLVGYDSFPSRLMPAYAFAGAPRLHNGLASDEFPAILQKGERVIPRGQGSGGSITINVPISADVGSKKMIADLKSGIESTVTSIIRKHS